MVDITIKHANNRGTVNIQHVIQLSNQILQHLDRACKVVKHTTLLQKPRIEIVGQLAVSSLLVDRTIAIATLQQQLDRRTRTETVEKRQLDLYTGWHTLGHIGNIDVIVARKSSLSDFLNELVHDGK